MAGKGTIFFILGTLFGGLCSATVALSWPSSQGVHAQQASKMAPKRALDKTQRHASSAMACPKVDAKALMHLAKPLLAAGAALNASQAKDSPHFQADSPQDDQELEAQEPWSPEEEQAFYEQEKKYHQARQEQIEKMRQDLVRNAKLDGDEKSEFLALVKQVTQKLIDGERELNELMGPVAGIDPEAVDEDPDQAPEEPPRLALLQNDFERSKALMNAQSRYEALLGPERLKALGPQFQAVEAFIKDEPLSDAFTAPFKGEYAREPIR